jgi:putative oxidoreductase
MTTATIPEQADERLRDRIRATSPHRHLLVPRLLAGVPLLGIGIAHVVVPEAPMRPLVDAAGFPLPAVLSPLGVTILIVAGASLLLGLWARVGALLAVPVMVGAVYAHLVIDVWPNGAENEPPLGLPITVMLAALYLAWRGAGRWSLDRASNRHRDGRSSYSSGRTTRPSDSRPKPGL